MILVRTKFTKNGKIRFTSHRDVARIWERAIRIAGVAMVYSEGFSPRPRFSFGLALPTGYESDGEYIDLQLDDTEPLISAVGELPGLLSQALPEGLEVTGIAILEPKTPSLQQAVTSCVWDITVKQTIEELNEWTERVLDAPTIVVTRERKGKAVTDDLRPFIRSLTVHPSTELNSSAMLTAELGTQPRSLRPAELLVALEPRVAEVKIRRCKQWIEQDGARLEPLEVGAAPVAHTTKCAS